MYKSTWKKFKKLRKENQEAEGHVVAVKNLCVALDVATKLWNVSLTYASQYGECSDMWFKKLLTINIMK